MDINKQIKAYIKGWHMMDYVKFNRAADATVGPPLLPLG